MILEDHLHHMSIIHVRAEGCRHTFAISGTTFSDFRTEIDTTAQLEQKSEVNFKSKKPSRPKTQKPKIKTIKNLKLKVVISSDSARVLVYQDNDVCYIGQEARAGAEGDEKENAQRGGCEVRHWQLQIQC